MRPRILIIFVCIFLVGTAISKDVKVTEQTNVEGFFPTDQIASDQSGRRNFIVLAMAAYPSLNNMLECVVSKNDSRYLYHSIKHYADANKNIQIHISVTGPEYRSYTSSKISVNANTYYTTSINWSSTWKAGVYKVIFVIEVIGGKGGSTLVETYSFIVV
jgi:hypothetical protein